MDGHRRPPVDSVRPACYVSHRRRHVGARMVAIDEKSMPCSEASLRRAHPPVDNLYQGMTLDAVTGLYYERFRNYSPTLGRWTSQDPLGYVNGANTYQFVNSSPVGNVDAEGFSHVRTVVDRVSLLGLDVVNVYITVKYSFKALSAHVRHVRITGLSVTGQVYGVNVGWGVRADATAFVVTVKDHCPCGKKRPEVWVDLHLYKVYFLVTVAFAHGLLPVAEGPCK